MEEEVVFIDRSWWSFLVWGIIAIAFGIILIAKPSATARTFFWLFGIYVLLYGLVAIIKGIVHLFKKEKWLWTFVWGILGFLIGGIVLGHLDKATTGSVWFLAILVGIWVVLMGVVLLAHAFDLPPDSGRGWLGILGVITAIFGIVILIYPFNSVYALMVILAIFALVTGFFDIILAFYTLVRERKIKKQLKAA